MCVRTCDGYYWPIAYPVAPGDLARSEAECRASCGTEVRLYTRSGPDADVEEMRDTEGRAYGSTPTAFLYRKRLVDGCACRGMPWSPSEVARHERYALIEAEQKLRVAEAERVATEQKEAEQREKDRRAAQPHVAASQPAGPSSEGNSSATGMATATAATLAALSALDAADVSKPGARPVARRAQPSAERSAKSSTAAASAPAKRQKRVQVAESGGSLFGGAKYRYPGD